MLQKKIYNKWVLIKKKRHEEKGLKNILKERFKQNRNIRVKSSVRVSAKVTLGVSAFLNLLKKQFHDEC